jgi:hypothetical protein
MGFLNAVTALLLFQLAGATIVLLLGPRSPPFW